MLFIHTELGVPTGVWLDQQRPDVREIRNRYGGGCFYNLDPHQFLRGVNRGGR
jgi:hypothetical protein